MMILFLFLFLDDCCLGACIVLAALYSVKGCSVRAGARLGSVFMLLFFAYTDLWLFGSSLIG